MESLKNIIFIDIETVPVAKTYDEISQGLQKEWERKSRTIKPPIDMENPDAARLFEARAGVYSEFAKVVCIGIGGLFFQENKWKIALKTISDFDEKNLLKEFSVQVAKFAERNKEVRFCGHNIKEFDMPFICRRMVINNIPLPTSLQLNGKKPWEVSHIDTMDLWRFGDYKNFTALSLLAEVLGIPSPKDDLDGSMVAPVFYNDGDLKRISKYCLQDVLTTAKVYLRLSGNNIEIEPEYI